METISFLASSWFAIEWYDKKNTHLRIFGQRNEAWSTTNCFSSTRMRAATYAGGCATTAYSRLDATTVPVSSVRFAEFKWVRWRWGLSARVVPCCTSELYTAYWKPCRNLILLCSLCRWVSSGCFPTLRRLTILVPGSLQRLRTNRKAKSLVPSTHQLHSRMCESVARIGVSALYKKAYFFDKRFGTVVCIAASQPRLNLFTLHNVCITHLQETDLRHTWKCCKPRMSSYQEKKHFEAEFEEVMLTAVQPSPLPSNSQLVTCTPNYKPSHEAVIWDYFYSMPNRVISCYIII